jgi:hypothetical protein
MNDTGPKIIAELEILLAANPKVEVKDGAGIIRARAVDQSIRRKALEDCLAVARGCLITGGR